MSSRQSNPRAQSAFESPSINRGPVDARAFAVGSQTGAPQGQKILRASPNLLKALRGGSVPGRARGLDSGLRGPRLPQQRKQGQQGAKRQRRGKRQDTQDDAENPYAHLSASEKEALAQKFENERPKPMPYVPQGQDIHGSLKDTWPGLPIGKHGTLANARALLSKIGARYANGWDAPSDLAKRLIAGKPVLFTSIEEKEKVVEVANELVRREAAAIEISTGKKQEPKPINFQAMDVDARHELLNRLVRGAYGNSMPEIPKDAPAIVSGVATNLQHNSSYQQSEILNFVSALTAKLPKKAAAGKK